MRRLQSFDVFDTVITRTVGDPRTVFRLWAQHVVSQLHFDADVAALAASRHAVERELNGWTNRHTPLLDIHRALAHRYGWDASVAADLAAAEEQIERGLVRAIPGAESMLSRARSSGGVIFVSDTPHSEPFIRELLEQVGLFHPGDQVFTSSARGASKSRGGLFRVLSSELGTRSVLHHGDDVHSDVASARWEGWQARWTTPARLNRYERALVAADAETAGLGSLIAGSGRLTRLEAVVSGTPGPVANVTTGVMAPLLIGYVSWCLERARHSGLERLYFVARDGEVMLRVAHELSGLAPGVELRYLHGSRQPWVLGATASRPDLLQSWVMGRTDFTAATALGRLGVDPAEFHAATGFAASSPTRVDTVMSRAEREDLARLVQLDPFSAHVRSTARTVADRCTDYFRQEGLLDGRPFGLVDAGWSGRASAALDELVRAAGGAPGTHYYVGQLGSAREASVRDGVRIEPWLFDKQGDPGSLGRLTSPNVLVEMFCAGTTGRTIDYEPGPGNSIAPVLDRKDNTEALEWGIERVQELAVRVAAQVGERWPSTAPFDLTRVVRQLLTMFWEEPTSAEVSTWGTFPGEEEIWPPFMELAQPVTTRSVLARLRRGETRLRPNNTWRAGSVSVSRPPWSTLVAMRERRRHVQRPVRTWTRRQALRGLRVWARNSPLG